MYEREATERHRVCVVSMLVAQAQAHPRRSRTRIWHSCFYYFVGRRMLFDINKNYDANGVVAALPVGVVLYSCFPCPYKVHPLLYLV